MEEYNKDDKSIVITESHNINLKTNIVESIAESILCCELAIVKTYTKETTFRTT